jgi:hypothetical protein
MIRRIPIALLAAALVAIAPVSSALAQDDPQPEPLASLENVSGGTTSLMLDETFTNLLNKAGLDLAGAGAAEIDGSTAQFPIAGGELTVFEPGDVMPFVQGELRHNGGLQIEGASTRVITLSDFRIDPDASRLLGDISVAGVQIVDDVPLFFLDGRTLEEFETGDGGQAVLDGATVKLNRNAAALLNALLGTEALKEGLRFGTSRIVAEPAGG